MTVDRPEVAEAELLEQYPGSQEGFHTLLPFPHQSADSRERARGSVDDASDRRADSIVERISLNRSQVLRDRTDVWRDRHLVVIENDDEIPLGGASVVEPFVCQSTSESAIAEY